LLLSTSIREKSFLDFRAVAGRSLILVRNQDAVFPAGVFASVQTRSVDRVGRHVAKCFSRFKVAIWYFLKISQNSSGQPHLTL
jgi:hypothetical protein